jgi:hypothetical protein
VDHGVDDGVGGWQCVDNCVEDSVDDCAEDCVDDCGTW